MNTPKKYRDCQTVQERFEWFAAHKPSAQKHHDSNFNPVWWPTVGGELVTMCDPSISHPTRKAALHEAKLYHAHCVEKSKP